MKCDTDGCNNESELPWNKQHLCTKCFVKLFGYKCDCCKVERASADCCVDEVNYLCPLCFSNPPRCKQCKHLLIRNKCLLCSMPSARMFHPHNGRDGFEHATSHVKLEDIRLTMTPALQQAIEERYKEIGDAAFTEFGL